MKKINNYAMAILMLVFVGFVGCQKESTFENLETEAISQPLADIEVLHYTNSKAKKVSILSFVDEKALDNTIKQLKQQKEEHESNFYNENKHLDIDAYNTKLETASFDEYAPLKSFSSQYNHKSLINAYIQAENEWLQQEELLDETDPENLFNDLDQYELSVVNTDYAVKIGNTILVFVKGGTVEITDADLATINKITSYKNIHDINEVDFKNLKLYPSIVLSEETSEKALCWGDDCDIYEYEYYNWGYLTEEIEGKWYKFEMRLSSKYYRVYWGHWKLKFYAKTKSYKKRDKWWGVWKKHYVQVIKAGLRGYFDTYTGTGTGGYCNCGDGEFYFGYWATTTKINAKEAVFEVVYDFYEEEPHWSIHDWWVKSYHYINNYGNHTKYRYTNE